MCKQVLEGWWHSLQSCYAHASISLVTCVFSSFPVLQPAETNKAKARSASLTLRSAMWEYCCEARWIVFCFSLFFFLSAQCCRQVGIGDECCSWHEGKGCTVLLLPSAPAAQHTAQDAPCICIC